MRDRGHLQELIKPPPPKHTHTHTPADTPLHTDRETNRYMLMLLQMFSCRTHKKPSKEQAAFLFRMLVCTIKPEK